MDKTKLREQRRNGVSGTEEGLASAPKVVLSYLAQRNQRATSQTRSPSHPSRVSQDQHPVDLHATWRTGGVASDRGLGNLKSNESEYVKFVEELLDRALKKDTENRGLSKKIREMEVRFEEMSQKMAGLCKEVAKERQQSAEPHLHIPENTPRVPLPSLSEELRVTPINQPRASSETRGTSLTAVQYKDERLKKVEQRVGKIEKMLEEQTSSIKDGCMQELMVYTNNYLSARLSAGGLKGSNKDEISAERLSENLPTLNAYLATFREEFNLKLQMLMEEIQRTVTLREMDQKIAEVSRAISKSSLEHLNSVEKRISPLEEGFLFLRSSVERILKMFESRIAHIQPKVEKNVPSTSFGVNPHHHPLLGSEYDNLDENQRQSVDELCDPSLLSTNHHRQKQQTSPMGKTVFISYDHLSQNDAKPAPISQTAQAKVHQPPQSTYFDPHRFPARLADPKAQPLGHPDSASLQQPPNQVPHEERVYFPKIESGNPPYVLLDSSDCRPGYPIRMMVPTTLISQQGDQRHLPRSSNHKSQEEGSPNNTLLSSQYQLKPPKSRQMSASPQQSSTERLAHAPHKLAEAETEASWNRVNRSQSTGHHNKLISNPQTLGIIRRAGNSIVDSSTTVLAATTPLQTLQQLLGRQPSAKKAARSSSSKSTKKQRKKDKIRSLLGQKASGTKNVA